MNAQKNEDRRFVFIKSLYIQQCSLLKRHSIFKVTRICIATGTLITKTCLYNIDPLKPNFYIVKLGFTWYTSFFLFLPKNIDCGYSLDPPRRGGSNEYPQFMFWPDVWEISEFLSENFHFFFFVVKMFSIFE